MHEDPLSGVAAPAELLEQIAASCGATEVMLLFVLIVLVVISGQLFAIAAELRKRG